MSQHYLDRLLRPRSVAVVGASAKGNRGSRILRNLRRFGFEGHACAINPNYKDVEGYPCYGSLDDTPEAPDFVAIAVPAAGAVAAVEAAVKRGSRAGLIIGGGFGEGAGEGADLAARIKEIAAAHEFKLCGPNCYGVLNVTDRVAAFSGNVVDPLTPGSIGFVLQSGAISHATHDTALGRGLGISAIITSGNELTCELSEYVDWMVQDPATKVIAVFIEGLKNPQRFAIAARKALEAGKPVVALKVGRSERGRRSTLAHTGSVAGSDESYEGLFRRAGVIRVNDLEEYIETLLLMSSTRRPRSSGMALASISGGLTTLISDVSEDVGIDLPAISDATREALSAALPGFGLASNPLDTTGLLAEKPEILPRVTQAFLDDEAISSFGLLFNTPRGCEPQRKLYLSHAEVLNKAQALTDKPLFGLAVVAGRIDEEVAQILGRSGVPFLNGAKAGLRALKHWSNYSQRRDVLLKRPQPNASLPSLHEPLAVEKVFSERESMEILQKYGVPFPKRWSASNAVDAVQRSKEAGFPVVMKVDSEDIAHKTEVGGVKVNLQNEAEVQAAFDAIMSSVKRHAPAARLAGVTIQPMIRGGLEILLGVVRDPQFGPQIVVGLGGVFVELFKDAQVRQLPITREDAREMLEAPMLKMLLGGYRGARRSDVEALIDCMLALSTAGLELGDRLGEIDLNPVRVMEEGKGVIALDALIVASGRP